MNLIGQPIPKITKELIEHLKARFPREAVVPDVTTIDQLMFNAGQLSIIDWLEHNV